MTDKINSSKAKLLRASVKIVRQELDAGHEFDGDCLNDLADECDSLVGALEAAWLRLTAKQKEDDNGS